ncbi:MAG TPA: hypothetical protein VH880_12620 [Anaeromyxobacteraceae bacterium]
MRPLALALLLAPAIGMAQARPRDGSEPPARYLAPLAVGVRLGGLAAYGAPASRRTAVGGGVYGLFDAQGIIADVAADAFAGRDATSLTAGLGVYWPALPAENTSPYLGGGVRLGWTRFGGDGAFGMQLCAAAGILASRQWSPHVRLEIAWFWNTMGERPSGGGADRFASGPVATLGLGF